MARAHPTTSGNDDGTSSPMSPALFLHAAWITAAVAVCLALCTIHTRKASFSLRRRGSSSSSSSSARSCVSTRESITTTVGGSINGEGGFAATGGATPAAKVSPTPSDAPNNKADDSNNNGGGGEAPAPPPRTTMAEAVTVIDVGSHGPLAPVFVAPPPDPIPPRRSLSAKHIRLAERLGRIRSLRRGPAAADDDDDVFVGLRGGGDGAVLWTKTIILGERCRVPSGLEEGDEGAGGDTTVPWKSCRPRQPRSVPVTRNNSFAGVGACKRADVDTRY